jgi:hypothetical protein
MITVIWDICDTLNDSKYRWFINFKFHNTLCILEDYKDLCEDPPWKLMGITKERYLTSLDNYRLSSYKFLEPNKEFLEWFIDHGEKTEHIALTEIPLKCAHISSDWVFTHFGNWIRTFHCIPSTRRYCYPPEYHKNKAEYIRDLNKDNLIFIDDNEENIEEIEKLKLNIKTFCVKQPWNSGMSINRILKKLNKMIDKYNDG